MAVATPARIPNLEGTFSMPSSHSPDGLAVAFDDDHAVANAGLLLPATLAERLGIEAVIDQLVDLGTRPGHHRPGRKVLTLVHALVAGGDCIDDADVLRTGATEAVLGHRVMAPSTLGTFLRSFTFGHIRQLDRVAETVMGRAWAAGGGPGDRPMTIDLDSTIWEVHGHHKGGAAYGYTRQLGYHPLLATRADTSEVLHARQRTGRAASGRGAERFVNELAAPGPPRRRQRPVDVAGRLGLLVGQGAGGLPTPPHPVLDHRAADQDRGGGHRRHRRGAWADIDYPDGGVAQVAETTLGGDRLIVRRTRLLGAQATLWPDWRYHAFVTDRPGHGIDLDADHRRHAVCELAIRDLKDGAGLRHCPSGVFLANAAWLVLATLAHNLLRWVATIGLGSAELVVAKTLRRRLLHLPGRLTRSARRRRLHLPTDWPWPSGS
jgi:hypothetical protein